MNKVAIVTGGGTGIGKGIAEKLLESGYDVAISYLSSDEGAKALLPKAEKLNRKLVLIKADISKYNDIINLFSEFKKHFDRLDLFVNNAGVTAKSFFLDTDEALFDSMCNVDFKGAYFCIQQAAKMMVEKKIEGNIIAISSNHSSAHFAEVSVYGSVKAALNKLCEHAAIELAKHKIRVNIVSPGWTDTGAARLDAKQDTYYKIPLKKWTTPEEIADAVLFLASDSAKSITGVNLVIDNGALLLRDKGERYGL